MIVFVTLICTFMTQEKKRQQITVCPRDLHRRMLKGLPLIPRTYIFSVLYQLSDLKWHYRSDLPKSNICNIGCIQYVRKWAWRVYFYPISNKYHRIYLVTSSKTKLDISSYHSMACLIRKPWNTSRPEDLGPRFYNYRAYSIFVDRFFLGIYHCRPFFLF